mmetsp:Transcript_41636/g.87328  ORF Transcript_41636/g.87328 Transcript_41636/m.87328 type:complete len:145 (+) Transcript_41636:69-503(+)
MANFTSSSSSTTDSTSDETSQSGGPTTNIRLYLRASNLPKSIIQQHPDTLARISLVPPSSSSSSSSERQRHQQQQPGLLPPPVPPPGGECGGGSGGSGGGGGGGDGDGDGVWRREELIGPIPYLPGNEEYGKEIEVVIFVYRVL